MAGDVVAKEIQVADTKDALVGVDDDAMRCESSEHSSQVIKILFRGWAGDEDIVNVGVC